MHKVAILILLLLIGILAGHSKAFAEEKTKGKMITNPNRSSSEQVDSDVFNGTPTSPRVTAALYQSSSTEVVLNDIWADWNRDNDGDGYYSKFNLSFDFDAPHSTQTIYVTGTLTGRGGEATSQPLFTTEPYTIQQSSGGDAYQMTVLLTDGYPTNTYQLQLAVYDAESKALIHQFDGYDANLLHDLYLEDANQDSPTPENITRASHVELYELAFSLYDDFDNDGYFTRIDIQMDVDAPSDARWIYAKLYLIDEYGQYLFLKDTREFHIEDYDNDEYRMEALLEFGFSPQRYQLSVELYDADTHNLLLTSEAPSSTPAHMESLDWEHSTEVVVIEEETHSDHHGSGGSLTLWSLFIFGLVNLVQKKQNRK